MTEGPRPGLDVESFTVSGVRIDAITLRDCEELVVGWIREDERRYVVLTGAHGVVEMQDDDELRRINNAADLVTPDGMSVVWVGRLKGHPRVEKVYAPTIMEALFARSVKEGFSHYFYGGAEGVADALAQAAQAKFPGLRVAGTFCPPFRPLTEDEEEALAEDIAEKRPGIVWVGLGCPKQERFMARMRDKLDAPVLIGVGAGFDFLTGRVPLAPTWVQHSGFEWFYRLVSEPKRLFPRYSRVVPRFLYCAGRDLVRERRNDARHRA